MVKHLTSLSRVTGLIMSLFNLMLIKKNIVQCRGTNLFSYVGSGNRCLHVGVSILLNIYLLEKLNLYIKMWLAFFVRLVDHLDR